VISVAEHRIVGRVAQASPFCPNIAATPDGAQVWMTLKDTGRTQVFNARPPFNVLATLDTGPITNHVNIVRNAHGQFAYVTIGGLNEVKVFRTDTFQQVATIPVGDLPHGIWPSGDGTRVYVGLENADRVVAIDTLTNTVIATSPIGQGPQALLYVPDASPSGDAPNLQPLGLAGEAAHLRLAPPGPAPEKAPTSVALFDQGLAQVLEASVTGLSPKSPYVLALSARADGAGPLTPLATFTTNPAGAAIVNAVGPIRALAQGGGERRFLVIVASGATQPVQIEIAP
jgi:YVTN family beta-propeller protein